MSKIEINCMTGHVNEIELTIEELSERESERLALLKEQTKPKPPTDQERIDMMENMILLMMEVQ